MTADEQPDMDEELINVAGRIYNAIGHEMRIDGKNQKLEEIDVEPIEHDGVTIDGYEIREGEIDITLMSGDDAVETVPFGLYTKAKIPEYLGDCGNALCDKKAYYWELSDTVCPACLEEKNLISVSPHPFGLVKSGKTDMIWYQQTNGVMCSHVAIEGTFIPLHRPTKFEDGKSRDLLQELRDANYSYNKERAKKIWDDIRDVLPFGFKNIDSPEDQPRNQEGLSWIRIYEVHTDYNWIPPGRNVEDGVFALFYPNCD